MIVAAQKTRFRPLPVLGKKLFLFPELVVFDQCRGNRQNRAAATVVFFKAHNRNILKILFEFKNVADIRAAPSVNRLIGIAGHRQIRPIARQRPRDGVLNQIGILVFINEHVSESVIESCADIFVIFQKKSGAHEQIIKVNRVGAPERLLISGIELFDQFPQQTSLVGAVIFGENHSVLRPADRGKNFRRVAAARKLAPVGKPFDETLRSIGIVNDEIRRQVRLFEMAVKNPKAKTVKRANPNTLTRNKIL